MQKGADFVQKRVKTARMVKSVSESYSEPYFDGLYGTDGHRPNDSRIVCFSRYLLPEDAVTSLHFHDTLEVGICLEGYGECHTKSGITATKPGDAELFFPYEPHLSRSKIGGNSVWDFIQIDIGRLCRITGAANYSHLADMIETKVGLSGVLTVQKYPRLNEIISQIAFEAVENREERYLIIMSLLCELLVLDSRLSEPLAKINCPADPKLARIKPALDYIFTHPTNRVSINELAEKCHISVSQMRSYFYDVTGRTPKEYITAAKIHHAEMLLTTTDMSVLEIALEIGFGDVSSFYRAFTTADGISPTEFRKSAEQTRLCE